MSRTLCLACERPKKACICDFIVQVSNKVPVIILQHPSEVSQMKGTVALLSRSLQSCEVIVAENFDQVLEFDRHQKNRRLVLLYPSEQATLLSASSIPDLITTQQTKSTGVNEPKEISLVILDGTWKKAYRMFMLSKKLQALPQVCLPASIASSGNYSIRKVAKKNALSSLEAVCYALAMLEADNKKVGNKVVDITSSFAAQYQPLLEKFKQFNLFQLSFRPDYLAPHGATSKES
jgi:DTW domain-containing protein YfiP